MTGQSTAAPFVSSVGLLERSIGYTRVTLSSVGQQSLRLPTPCQDWDLHDLLTHMDDSLVALTEAARSSVVGLEVVDDAGTAEDLVERVRRRACALLGAWVRAERHSWVSVGGAPLTTELLLAAGALEIAVHGWDVGSACGIKRSIPARLGADLQQYLPALVTHVDRPARFADPVSARPGAGPAERLLASLGRTG
ncbi:MAG: TIGR03086 family metal-binding protein [Jatrophihabitans sp.]